MTTILLIIIIFAAIAICGETKADREFRKQNKKYWKNVEKARQRAAEDAYEDFLMYYEVFHEDDWC